MCTKKCKNSEHTVTGTITFHCQVSTFLELLQVFTTHVLPDMVVKIVRAIHLDKT